MKQEEQRPPLEDLLHDLRTPLSVVKGSMRTVLRHWDALDDDKRRELLTRALDGADTLAASISTWAEAAKNGEASVSATVQDAEVSSSAGAPGGANRGGDAGGMARPRLRAIATERSSDRFTARVVLDDRGEPASGETTTSAGRRSEERSIARATLDALARRLDLGVEVDDVDVVEAGGERVALIALSSGRQSLLGSAMVTSDDHEAVSKATLDALNRVVGKPRSASHDRSSRS